MAFFDSKNDQNFQLGVQLLQSTRDPKILIQVLSSKIYSSGRLCYCMVPFFQQNPVLWKSIREYLPYYIYSEIDKWLPYKILEFNGNSIATFCLFSTQKVREYFPNFPQLSKTILTESQDYGMAYVEWGEKIVDGIGWSLSIDSSMYGPAEVCSEEEWKAIAYHPDYSITIERLEDSAAPTKTWLQIIKPRKL